MSEPFGLRPCGRARVSLETNSSNLRNSCRAAPHLCCIHRRPSSNRRSAAMAAQISSNSSQHGATLQAALLSIALQAKAAYEAAYDSAQIRGGSELDVAAAGAEDSATIGEVALHAITQCDWLIEQCRALPEP